MDKKPPLITTLPINDEVFSFNVGNGTVRYSPPDGTAEFFNKVQEVGSSFSKTNRMDLEYPYGHFLISENLQVIGLSLLPRLTYHDVMPLGLVGWPTDSMAGLPDEWLCVDGGLLSIRKCSNTMILRGDSVIIPRRDSNGKLPTVTSRWFSSAWDLQDARDRSMSMSIK